MLSTYALDTQVLQKGLCTGCGACQGLCPYWDSFKGRTFYNFDCDRKYGRCQSFCPRMDTDLEALRNMFFDASTVLPEIGPFRELYLTRATDKNIAEKAQHGGTMTALLELALKEGFIDSAVLSKSKGTLEPEGVLAVTPEEIRACSGSSFNIAPTLAVLNKTLKENKYKSIGVVGTPCKTLAVYKMKSKPVPENDNNADNIGMVFGLFCGWGLDWDGLSALKDKYSEGSEVSHMDIPPSKYHSLEMTDSLHNTISVNLDEVLPLVKGNCHFCADMTAEFSDLSVGGARSEAGWDEDKHWNQLIVRTEKGEKLVKLAEEKGILEFKDIPSGGLEKLKNASLGKKRTGIRNIKYLSGNENDLLYLNSSKKLFENL